MSKVYQVLKTVKTMQYGQYYDLTSLVEEEVKKSGIRNGVAIVSVLHTTAAITMQEPDTTVHRDGILVLDSAVPTQMDYEHLYEGKINATAHQKQMLIGNSRTVPVKDGYLVLGTWQKLFLVELFRSMNRSVFITIFGTE